MSKGPVKRADRTEFFRRMKIAIQINKKIRNYSEQEL